MKRSVVIAVVLLAVLLVAALGLRALLGSLGEEPAREALEKPEEEAPAAGAAEKGTLAMDELAEEESSEEVAVDEPVEAEAPTIEVPVDEDLAEKMALEQSPRIADLGDMWVRPADGMTMVFVPAGSFPMGSEDGSADEQPVHDVTLEAFWIDQTEVSNAQYERCVSEGSCEPSDYATDDWFNGDAYPVVGVDWYDADAYCAWAKAQLPTEAQREYAARGSEGNRYPWGDAAPTCDLAQFDGCDGDTIPVGSLPDGASWVGAFDMSGNVWEWVSDWYDPEYYETSPAENPEGPVNGDFKVLRGGSLHNDAATQLGADRNYLYPDSRINGLGFRCSIALVR
ncbi:MAG: formylglycine-generating enzyme family protein [Candidatus Promineifilaceae bacterium]|jgi:formylglycine-generating enzyme required for sulfatase activity